MSGFESRKNGKKTGYRSPPEHTRFKAGNPGRPKGSRNKLGEEFLVALCQDFTTHGPAVIARVREEDPAAYLKIVASLMPKEIDLTATDPLRDASDEELDALLAIVRDRIAAGPDDEGGEQEAA